MSIVHTANSVHFGGGTFSVITDGESNTNPGMKLRSHVSPAALHYSQEQRISKDFDKTVKDIVREWSSHPQNISLLNTSSYPQTLSDQSVVYNALRDVLQWFYDPFTPFLIKWMHGERSQTMLLAHVLADMLYERESLSATFFSSTSGEPINSASVLPTIVYQLSQNIPLAKDHITRAVADDMNIFTLTLDQQVQKLVIEPLMNASKTDTKSTVTSHLILIHGLEDCDSDVDFQESFLESFSRALVSIQDFAFSHKLLILGRYTDVLEESFSNVAYQPTPQPSSLLLQNGFPNVRASPPVLQSPRLLQKCFPHLSKRPIALQRPLLLHAWIGRRQDLCRREKEVEQREEKLEEKLDTFIKGLRPQTYQRLEQREQEVARREEEVQLLERDADLKAMNVARENQDLEQRLKGLVARELSIKVTESRLEQERKELNEKEEQIKQREHIVEKKEEDYKRAITLAPPPNPVELKKLAYHTRESLQGLEPLYNPSSRWYKGEREIPPHVKKIVSAIGSSIAASEHGCSITSEVVNFMLSYTIIVNSEETNVEGWKNLQESLQTISLLAEEGHALSANALNEFQGIRRRLEKVGINYVPHLIAFEKGNDLLKIVKNLGQHWSIANDAVDNLEEFARILGVYVKWWTDLKVKAQEARRNRLNMNLYPYHEKVLAEWEALKDDYATYSQEITGIQHSYRHMLQTSPS